MFEYLCTSVYIVSNVDYRQLGLVVHIGCALNDYARPKMGACVPGLAVQKACNASNDQMVGC
jgi:hypothetical protein